MNLNASRSNVCAHRRVAFLQFQFNAFDKREVAEQLLENDLYELCRNQTVQPKLLAQLKVDEHLVRQLFQSAYAGDLQEDILEACDWFGESVLKEHLQNQQQSF